jgi:hypothetical protein
MRYGYDYYGPMAGFGFSAFDLGFMLLLVWTLYWKGTALWRAARLGHKEWFIALLIINTMGLLEIAYLYYFTNSDADEKEIYVESEKK